MPVLVSRNQSNTDVKMPDIEKTIAQGLPILDHETLFANKKRPDRNSEDQNTVVK